MGAIFGIWFLLLSALPAASAAADGRDGAADGCAAWAYAETNFRGASACVPAAGYVDAAALSRLGLPGGTFRSLSVLPGYQARLARAGVAGGPLAAQGDGGSKDGTGGGDAVDGADDTVLRQVGALGALPLAGEGGACRAVQVLARPRAVPRPRVLLALTGSNDLADHDNAAAWAGVAAGVDGIWGNDAYISPPDEAAIYRQVHARTLIQEQDASGRRARLVPVGIYAGLERQYPELGLVREAVALHRDSPAHWQLGDVARMREAYIAAPAVAERYRFARVYTGWQAGWGTAALPAAAAAALAEGDGAFVECDAATCRGADRRGLFRLAAAARAGGRPFIWYDGTGGAPDGASFLQATVDLLVALGDAGLLGPDDAVAVVNERRWLPTLPERDPDGRPAPTVAGTLLWLLGLPR